MDFHEQQPIYLQIADYVCEKILLKKWPPGEKIISIRELATDIQVNPNTVQRAYDFLQQKDIIINRRGVGYFVEKDAEKKVKVYRKEKFTESELPHLLRNMFLLGISFEELEQKYKKFIDKNFKKSINEME
jgi:DNA-binding transcriptional regulator YhcF (GntR family)